MLPDIIISVKIEGTVHERNLSEDLKVDEEHINDYLIRAPGLVAYWNTLYHKQKAITQRLKVTLDRKHAELDRKIRQEAAEEGKKVTNPEVEAAIRIHPDYIEIQDKYLDAVETEGLLKGAVNAIQELRSTLISLSANLRATGDIIIKDKSKQLDQQFRERYLKKSRS